MEETASRANMAFLINIFLLAAVRALQQTFTLFYLIARRTADSDCELILKQEEKNDFYYKYFYCCGRSTQRDAESERVCFDCARGRSFARAI